MPTTSSSLPDTQLWRRLKREGRLLVESTGNNTDASLNFIPRMDTTRLIEGYQALMRTLYSPGEYYQRALASLQQVGYVGPEPRSDSLIADLLTLARLTYALGIRDDARGEFWRYLRRVLREHREQIGPAVKLAATGYHFRKLTGRYG